MKIIEGKVQDMATCNNHPVFGHHVAFTLDGVYCESTNAYDAEGMDMSIEDGEHIQVMLNDSEIVAWCYMDSNHNHDAILCGDTV